ncbi:MAG: Gfo/Idh/MocA family protein [Boseongicola sp.]
MAESSQVRWGILGGARFAREQMGPAIHAAEDATLAGLATSSAEKAAQFQSFAPNLRLFDCYESLLESPEIDAVYVPLPNHMHVEWTLKALEAGKPVLTEKPIAMTEAEFDTLIAARDKSGLLAAEAYMIVHHPQWQRARELVQSSAIGQLHHVDGFFSYDNSSDVENIRNRPETGGGSIPDIGVYTMGSARFVTGEEPEHVAAEITWENGVDVTAHVTAAFPSFRFQASTSMRMHPRQEMTFHGSEGIVRLTAPFNTNIFGQAEVHLHKNAHRPGQIPEITIERWPGINQYVIQVENFGRAMRGEIEYPCPLEFSRGTQAMIDKVFRAGRAT